MSNDFKKSFGSDNHSGVHPKILQALVEANSSHAPSYGTDAITERVEKLFKQQFGDHCRPFFVFNGSAANVLALLSLTPSWRSVICTDLSHLNVDECAAPEAIGRVKLMTVPSQNGKLCVSQLESLLVRRGDQHFASPGMISITQPTELGTVYSLEELREIRQFANQNELLVHVDGARLSNSLISLNCTFRDLYETLRPDAISFGGTKNGLLGAEAVLLFDEQRSKAFKFIRKQTLQLPSKTRFLAAQFEAYLSDDLYYEIARHSHEMALKLAQSLEGIRQMRVLYPVESNAVFATIPKSWTKKLREEVHFYVWDESQWSIRLMCSFDTEKDEIERFSKAAHALSQSGDPHE